MSNQLLTVSELAKICRITPRTIRWYQQLGILKPIRVGQLNKYAYFDATQALDIFKIKLMQQLDISLKTAYLKLNKGYSMDNEILKLEYFIKQKRILVKFLKNVNEILNKTDSGSLLKSESIGANTFLCLKVNQGDYYKFNDYLLQVKKMAKNKNISLAGDGIVFYLDLEMKYKPKSVPLEISFIVKTRPNKTTVLPKNYHFRIMPKIKVLSYAFEAPSLFLHDIFIPLIYEKLDKYLSKQNFIPNSSVFEVYLKNTKSCFKTKICYPI